MTHEMRTSQFLHLLLAQRGVSDAAALTAAAGLQTHRQVFQDKEAIVPSQTQLTASSLLIRGMAVRQHGASRGTCVISGICVPGDFVDIHSLLLKELDHEIVSVGTTAVEFVLHEDLLNLCHDHFEVSRTLWIEALLDAKAHRAWTVVAGSLRVMERIAHLLCELECRLARVGLADTGNFTMPLTQARVAEITGATPVHVNRALQDLREAGLVEWQGRTVRLPDLTGLRALCGFDPDYLTRRSIFEIIGP